jgi:glyoxylase-like metal-dependent hydrolase (beta-lactamase superfamily II)
VRYEPVEGELELLPGLGLVPAPGHTRGLQVVVVATGGRPVVVGGDVAVWIGELDEPRTEGQVRVRALEPEARLARARARALAAAHHIGRAAVPMARGDLHVGRPLEHNDRDGGSLAEADGNEIEPPSH